MTWCGNQPVRSFTQPDCSRLSSQSHCKKGVAFPTRASQRSRGTSAMCCKTFTVVISDINTDLSTRTCSIKLLSDDGPFNTAAVTLSTQDRQIYCWRPDDHRISCHLPPSKRS